MRNSTALRAGVPAPFTDLEPLKEYLRLLEEVVTHPSPETVGAYVAYDRDVYTPVAHVHSRPWRKPVEFYPCILYDGIESHGILAQIEDHDSDEFTRLFSGRYLTLAPYVREPNEEVESVDTTHKVSFNFVPKVPTAEDRAYFGSDAALRNSARCVVNELAVGAADSGAFPQEMVREAFQLLDAALVRLVGYDPKQLAFARKRMRRGLLRVWISETQYVSSWAAGDHHEILKNVRTGWSVFGAPYGLPWIAYLVGYFNPRRIY